MLHHVDGTLVDGVVGFVSQPVFVALPERNTEGGREVKVRRQRAAVGKEEKPAVGSHLFDGGDGDDEEERQAAGDGAGGRVDHQLEGRIQTEGVNWQTWTRYENEPLNLCFTCTRNMMRK